MQKRDMLSSINCYKIKEVNDTLIVQHNLSFCVLLLGYRLPHRKNKSIRIIFKKLCFPFFFYKMFISCYSNGEPQYSQIFRAPSVTLFTPPQFGHLTVFTLGFAAFAGCAVLTFVELCILCARHVLPTIGETRHLCI